MYLKIKSMLFQIIVNLFKLNYNSFFYYKQINNCDKIIKHLFSDMTTPRVIGQTIVE